MALETDLSPHQIQQIDELVQHVSTDKVLRSKMEALNSGLETIVRSNAFENLIHSYKSRLKDPSHLRNKLIRKFESYSTGGQLHLNKDNLGVEINDLVGLRILHLHTHQIVEIDKILKESLGDYGYVIREGPIARTWDDELRAYYKKHKITFTTSENMYTSVHYVVNLNNAKQDLTGEIQVRTLSEELWGEVDHLLNYPDPNASVACAEQIKVLARITSGASRLVDSIFLSDKLAKSENRPGLPDADLAPPRVKNTTKKAPAK